MLIKGLLCFILLLPLPAMAAWTGIAAFVGQSESDWLQAGEVNQADINFYGFRIEEKTNANLRVGARVGRFDLLLLNPLNVTTTEKYYGQFLSLYLRWPVKLLEQVTLHTSVNYQLNLGVESVDADNTEISWTDVRFQAGLSLQLGSISLRPFANFRSIDGDVTSSSQTNVFKQDSIVSQGLIIDFFVERSAFVRLQTMTGAQQSVFISFAREY